MKHLKEMIYRAKYESNRKYEVKLVKKEVSDHTGDARFNLVENFGFLNETVYDEWYTCKIERNLEINPTDDLFIVLEHKGCAYDGNVIWDGNIGFVHCSIFNIEVDNIWVELHLN